MPHETEYRKWQDQEHRRSQEKAGRALRKLEPMNGEIAHWVRTLGLLAPLAITEFVPDAARSKRFIRITSVAAAVLSEGFHAHRLHQQRDRARDALEACETAAML
jgi:hypothetical protein